MTYVISESPPKDVDALALASIVPGVGWGSILPYFDPLYHLLVGSVHVHRSTSDMDLEFMVHECTIDRATGERPNYEKRKLLIGSKPKGWDSSKLSAPHGYGRFQRFAILGPLASINHAYDAGEKNVDHQNGHGRIYPLARDGDSTVSRGDFQADVLGSVIHGCQVHQKRKLPTGEADNMFDLFFPDPSATHTSLRPWEQLVFADVVRQLKAQGHYGHSGDGFPSFGSLGAETPPYTNWLRVHAFDSVETHNGIELRYTTESWTRNTLQATHNICDVKFVVACVDSNQDGTWPYYTAGRSVVTAIHVVRRRYRFFRFGSKPDDMSGGETSLDDIIATSGFSPSIVLRWGTLPFLIPRKRPVMHDLTKIRFEHAAESFARDVVINDQLYTKWIEAIEEELYNLTDTNILETYGDVRELSGIIPPFNAQALLTGSLMDRLRALLDHVGAAGLYHNFVFSPTVGEIETYTEAIRDYTSEWQKRLSEKPHIVVRGNTSTVDGDYTITAAFKGVFATPRFTSVADALNRDIVRQGSFSNAYDLVPFSWLLDYFTNIGDTIGSVDAFIHNVNTIPLYVVRSYKVVRTFSADTFYVSQNKTDKFGGFVELQRYTRRVQLQPLMPSIQIRGSASLSSSRLFNLGAVFLGFI